ncbi:hypothetical protein K501DRAFT_316331 [Backusella circina FSU 941]|nr:hypothetical protein K501DRAFT_316331 [Backusella circina FSU 941]
MINKCRLAAVSNYKLAQLTFSTMDHGSLKRTALIKNLLEQLYHDDQDYDMTRWEFFTPESLEKKTQRDIERIIQRYTQLICTQSTIRINDRTTSLYYPKQEEVSSYATHLEAELINSFDMEFCLELSLPNYRASNSFDEPRYPQYHQDIPPPSPPKRVSSLEYRRSRSEPSLIDDDEEEDDIKSVSTDSLDTFELELEVQSSPRSSMLSDLFSFSFTTTKRQKSIKRFFSSFSSSKTEEEEEVIVIQPKLTRSKSVGTKLLKRIKTFKK